MRDDKSMIWINGWLILTLVALAILLAGCGIAGDSPSQTEAAQLDQPMNIKVVGQGEALGEPDEARVTVGVEVFSPKVDEATAENEAVITEILEALEESGIASEDIQTSNYSLWAEQRYGDNGPEGIAGYRVSNQVNVVIRDIEKVGEVLAAVTAAGANNIYGVQFSVSDPDELEVEAREKALLDAQMRADSLAQLSGLPLGDIVAIDETVGQYYSQYREMAVAGMGGGAAEGPASISPGRLSFQSQVQVTYSIGE